MLGPYLKYSCCLFSEGSVGLADAEVAMLHAFTEEHLRLSETAEQGALRVLDLGCGWGSHGGYILDNYDDVHVTFPVQQCDAAGLHQGAQRETRRAIHQCEG